MFSSNLRYLRNKFGIEQIELARKLGRKSGSTVSEWEKGTYTPKIKVLSEIASIFNVDLDDLMNKDLTKDDNETVIDQIVQKVTPLSPDRQTNVLTFAQSQLDEQNSEKISSIEDKQPTKTEDTDFLVAAHMDDNLTDDEKEEINTYINKLIKKHKEQDGGDSD
ncbi:helix-turn-helix transcriptional regulator [Aerococcus urinae]|uniref:helix-turn-helix transcriptional regulator n=1 Tax=Aerococcus urinae TaxID=1376 RepID=UPI00254E287E|nr:helix-turn-helix transcriptional regulator [Aerococcus urinae]MDK7716065.1 helix-turn-helix transcriptional regulator [Aerococcus urinae]